MGKRKAIIVMLLAFAIPAAVLVLAPAARGQAKAVNRRYVDPHSVSSPIRQVVMALGDRVQRAGKERLIMIGTVDRNGTVSTVRVVRELPGYLRIDETGARSRSLVFDLSELKGGAAVDDNDEELAEMLESDTGEDFLRQFAPGATIRKLGDRFQVKGESGFGSFVDIYEVVTQVSLKRNKQQVSKHYMFDSNTGLLRRVAYSAQRGTRKVLVQTVHSNYSQVDGYAIPGRTVRIVDGATSLTFIRTAAAVTPAVEDGSFGIIQR